ncbi:MAG: hypothetical protein MUF84_07360 [Anaerolineae bacterium]|jgi:hypothetical protein|nr:hypothetical protein [Anaerolineae bacterium]
MKVLQSRVLWGILLVVVGLLFLLESLAILSIGGAWAVLFAVAGLIFGYTYLEDRERWWALIPSMALLGLAALIGFEAFLPGVDGQWGVTLFMGALGLSFILIYFLTRRSQWWALIPGGVLATLGVALGLEPYMPGEAFVGVFFLGMALTFALVYALPTPEGRMLWAIFPAGVLALMGIIFLSIAGEAATLVWPVLLILTGGYVLLRSVRK